MNGYPCEQIEPACRFGPGGDFVSFWPGEAAVRTEPSLNPLRSQRHEMAGSCERPNGFTGLLRTIREKILRRKGKLNYAIGNNKADKPSYATSTTVIKSDSVFCGEPMLFADDWRIRLRAGHKPKHRIRAYQRASKKRAAVGLCGQGSLFEANFKSARTA